MTYPEDPDKFTFTTNLGSAEEKVLLALLEEPPSFISLRSKARKRTIDEWRALAPPNHGWFFAYDLAGEATGNVCRKTKTATIRERLFYKGLIEVKEFERKDPKHGIKRQLAMRLWRDPEGFRIVYSVILANERVWNAYRFGRAVTDKRLKDLLDKRATFTMSPYREAMKAEEEAVRARWERDIKALSEFLNEKIDEREEDKLARMRFHVRGEEDPSIQQFMQLMLDLAKMYLKPRGKIKKEVTARL